MNNPIDTDGFKHYLLFKSLGHTELYEISQPAGFDEANFTIEQNDERFGRDIMYGNSKANEVYYDVYGLEKGSAEQVIHPNGTISEYLDFGFNWILETYNRFGFEGHIERLLYKDGVLFNIGQLDMSEPDTDGATYFGCNVIQNTEIAIYKRQIDTKVNLFSTKNIKNEPIKPAPTLKFLRKAVAQPSTSKWQLSDASARVLSKVSAMVGDLENGFNLYKNIAVGDIQNTLTTETVSSAFYAGDSENRSYDINFDFVRWVPSGEDFVLIDARKITTINNIKLYIKTKISDYNGGVASFNQDTKLKYVIFKGTNETFQNSVINNLWQEVFSEIISVPGHVLDEYEFTKSVNLDLDISLDVGEKLFGMFTFEYSNTAYNFLQTEALNIEISAFQKSVDTVIGGVRYIDVLKQCSKFIDNLPIDASMFDEGGEYYDNVCYNRALLSTETSNSIELLSTSLPEGTEIGQVVTNSSEVYLPIGLYFWDGTEWLLIDENIEEITLSGNSTPAGSIGQLRFNTNDEVDPSGLCYWNGSSWVSLEIGRPFVTSMKDAYESAMTLETCADYEIQKDKIYFGQFSDFYTNDEIGNFDIVAGKDFKNPPNPKFKLNNLKFSYETFETFRLTKNSAQDIHTESEFSIPNRYVEDKFERSIKYIRSGFSAQALVDLEIKTPQTADENDDKVFINSIVPLPADSFGFLNLKLSMIIIGGAKLSISNKVVDIDETLFYWNNLGLTVGDTLEITEGTNAGTYTIESFTPYAIILVPVGFTPTFSGDEKIKIKHYYTNIFWQTKTNEGFDLIEGIDNADNYPNINYSIKRNLSRWFGYLKSACLRHADGLIKNLYFKNNTTLVSQVTGGELLKEKGDIVVGSMGDAILGDKLFELEVQASYSDMIDLLDTYKNNRGFIRCYDVAGRVAKGYPQILEYTWKSGSLRLTLEEKYEPDTVVLVYDDGVLTVNDTRYDLNGNLDWWKLSGEYFECYDANDKPLCNVRHYSNVNLNGTIYTSSNALYDALLAL
jgi:hypothetical protein